MKFGASLSGLFSAAVDKADAGARDADRFARHGNPMRELNPC